MPATCPTDCTGPARCWWSARWLRSAPCSSSPSRSVRLVRATPRQLDLLDACRRVLSIKDAVARGCRRVWPLNCHQWRCAGSVGECQSGSVEAAAVACAECEDVQNAKRTPVGSPGFWENFFAWWDTVSRRFEFALGYGIPDSFDAMKPLRNLEVWKRT